MNSINYRNFTNQEISKLVSYSIVFDNCEAARRKFTEEFDKPAPPVSTLKFRRAKFQETLSLLPKSHAGDQTKRQISDEKREEIVKAFGDGDCASQREAAKKFCVSLGAVNLILHDSNIRPFKFVKVQELLPGDQDRRKEFYTFVLDKLTIDPVWSNKIIFSDEATLHLSGCINHHNNFYYSEINEHRTVATLMKSPAITAWVMIPHDGRLRFRILFETMNSERYCDVLKDIVIPNLQSNRYRLHYFQQDGASVHFALTVRELLNRELCGRWIGRAGPISWPPRSPDLSINDFFLWSYVRDNVYKNPKARTLNELADRVEACLNSISPQTIKNCFQNFVKRCRVCLEQDGAHFENFM